MPSHALLTARLELVPVTLAVVEAVFSGDRARMEDAAGARLPDNAAWPSRALIERGFGASLERVREAPERRLWGDRLMITRDGARTIVGSVIFHGAPTPDGVVEVGYGVEEAWQRNGLASEATRAQVEWALTQPDVRKVAATTPPWHVASIRVLERAGLVRVGVDDHEALGEVLVFERAR